MKILSRLLCLSLALTMLFSCRKPVEPDSDPVDPNSLARETTLAALETAGELPDVNYSVSLLDSYNLPVKDATVTLSVRGYDDLYATTDEKGVASFTPAYEAGSHKATFTFPGSVYYKAATLHVTLVSEARINRSGVYLRGKDLSGVNLETLRENGVGNVYLHQEVLTSVSRVGIEEFISRSNKAGIRVHLWLICLWDQGDLVVPINTADGSYLQDYFDLEAEKVRDAASIKGLYGMHFDYIRFDGEDPRADKFKARAGGGGEHAVTEFVRQMTKAASDVNSSLVFSGAIMAEYADLIPKYGQDLTSLSEYLDFFVPMLYAGNYGKDLAWIEECVRMLRQNHPQMDLRPALLSYVSDQNQTNKTPDALSEEVRAVYDAGADGVTLFYYAEGSTTLVGLEPA